MGSLRFLSNHVLGRDKKNDRDGFKGARTYRGRFQDPAGALVLPMVPPGGSIDKMILS